MRTRHTPQPLTDTDRATPTRTKEQGMEKIVRTVEQEVFTVTTDTKVEWHTELPYGYVNEQCVFSINRDGSDQFVVRSYIPEVTVPGSFPTYALAQQAAQVALVS